jgi:hypothetical protein
MLLHQKGPSCSGLARTRRALRFSRTLFSMLNAVCFHAVFFLYVFFHIYRKPGNLTSFCNMLIFCIESLNISGILEMVFMYRGQSPLLVFI